MKNLLKFFATSIMIFSFNSSTNAQQWQGSTSHLNNIFRQGDITVIDGFMQRVNLGAAWGSGQLGGRGYLGFNLRRENTGNWTYIGDGAMNDGAAIVHSWNAILFSLRNSSGASSGSITDANIANNVVMKITGDGKVAIGNTMGNAPTFTSFPGDYKLYVEKGILTEKVRVAVHGTTSWADYVFEPDYNLMPLNELQTYISKNKHLPDVPSAEEVVEEGLDLGKMDAKLLQKIEELTLYVIKQQKEIEELKKKIDK